MSFADAIAQFRELHTRHKGKVLSREEGDAYAALRDDFARALLRAQRLAVQPGQTVRQALRVVSAMKLELNVGAQRHKTMTLDVGARGFAALVGNNMIVGTSVDFVLGSSDPIRGRARVVACDRHGSGGTSYRTSFAIDTIGDADREHLENLVIDAALAALGR